MLGDPYRHVKPGDDLAIPARTYNRFLDLARVHDLDGPRRGAILRATPDAGVVSVKNITGAALDRFAVVSVEAPIITRADNSDAFKERVTFDGGTPTASDYGYIGIVQSPAEENAIVPTVVSGVSIAKVFMHKAGERYADVDASSPTRLQSGQAGSVLILYVESGTGEKWAIVNVGGGSPGGAWYGVATGSIGAVAWSGAGEAASCTVNPSTRLGGDKIAAITHTVYLPRHGSVEDPNVRGGDVLAYVRDEAGYYVALNSKLDGTIDKTIRIWLDPENVPAGWTAVLDGKFLVGWASEDCDYGSVGASGGYKDHGNAGNNHDDHPDHTHVIPLCGYIDVDEGTYYPMAWNVESPTEPAGFASHSNTDNRPPYSVVVWIKRTS